MSAEPEDENVVTLEPEIPLGDVPGYLYLPEPLRAEGRRAFALSHVVDGDGVLLANAFEVLGDVQRWLEEGKLPNKGASKLATVKGGKE
jgi:hypothetical protein